MDDIADNQLHVAHLPEPIGAWSETRMAIPLANSPQAEITPMVTNPQECIVVC